MPPTTGPEIGSQIARLREAKGLTGRALADRTKEMDPKKRGVSHSYVQKLEGGRVESPGTARLLLIARALDLADVPTMLGWEPSANGVGDERARQLTDEMEQLRRRMDSFDLPPETVKIPIVDFRAGAGTYGEPGSGRVIGQESVSRDLVAGRTVRACHVIGDCMEPELYEGDLLIYEVTAVAPHNSLAVLVNLDEGENGGENVKRVEHASKTHYRLHCHKREPLLVRRDRVMIEGVVLESRRKYA